MGHILKALFQLPTGWRATPTALGNPQQEPFTLYIQPSAERGGHVPVYEEKILPTREQGMMGTDGQIPPQLPCESARAASVQARVCGEEASLGR